MQTLRVPMHEQAHKLMAVYSVMLTRPEPWPDNLRWHVDQRVIDGAHLWRVCEWHPHFGDPFAAWIYATNNAVIKALLVNWETGGTHAVDRLLGIVRPA